MKIALFLDIDGVLNQYRHSERIKRFENPKYKDEFDPYPKKILRLYKVLKKYNIDVHLFSAWTKEDLDTIVPFEILTDTGKYTENVNKISLDYDLSILLDDEACCYTVNDNIIKLQPNYLFGFTLQTQKDLIKIIEDFKSNQDKL